MTAPKQGKFRVAPPVARQVLPQAEASQLVALFNAGRYVELESRACGLAERYPNSGFVWKVLGVALQAQGKAALPVLQKAAQLLPGDADAHCNLGVAQKDLGHLADAVASYRRALALKPDLAEAHSNLGGVLQVLGQFDAALASCRRALALKPAYANAHLNLGNALRDLGQLEGAVASYRRALELKPDYAEAHCNSGNALKDLGQFAGAAASYRRALELKPAYVEAYLCQGNLLKDLGQLAGAAASFRRALQISPAYAEAHYNLGNALHGLGQVDNAVASYRRALAIKPGYAEAHDSLGTALKDLGMVDDAVASYRRALEIKPGYAEAHSNLLFVHNYQSDFTAVMLLAEARRFGDSVARQARPHTAWPNIADPAKCLRVGLVSGDLCNHPVGYFLESVLVALTGGASERLELFAYYNHVRNDAVSARIKACCHGWLPVAELSDESLARRIRDDDIDILIDLSGHSARNRLPLFAWKPSPLQVSWLGYFATAGVAAIDYLIADPWTLPESEAAHFSEKIWRLPETRLCFTPPEGAANVAPLPALANGYITFGCFNNLAKMTDAVVALWARVLAAVPDSRLFLKAKQLDEMLVRPSVVERFAAHGIDADRLILEGSSPRTEYLAAYQRVDIALDPFPYTGGTTSAEGLWMGVPVLTLAGESFLSRQGVGLLMNAGLPEWIAADTDDYIARAVSHASDLQRLSTLRNGLRQQALASPLFDAPRFAAHFEAALRGMWVDWCDRRQG